MGALTRFSRRLVPRLRSEAPSSLARDTRSFIWIDDARRDAGYALRLLRRSPIVAATAVVSLAIGIGANTTVFAIADALLFRAPTGVADPDRLVDVGVGRDGVANLNPTSYPVFLDIRDRAATLDGVFARRMFPQAVSVARADGASAASEPAFAQFV